MFGKIEFSQSVILVVAATAALTDLIRGKIYNWLTLPALVLGLVYFAFTSHLDMSFAQAVWGTLAGLLLYGWMYGLGILGAGDVKFLMALGAWGGLHYTEEVAILGVVLGGLQGIFTLIITGRFFDFCRRIYFFLLSIFLRELEFVPPKIDKTLKMPFGVPIAIAAIWVAFWHPFQRWGISFWP